MRKNEEKTYKIIAYTDIWRAIAWEFRQFGNGVMSRLDKQNKILTKLISIQKS